MPLVPSIFIVGCVPVLTCSLKSPSSPGTSTYAAPGRACASGVYSWSTAACCLERCWCLYVDICLAPSPTLPGCRATSDAWRHSLARSAPPPSVGLTARRPRPAPAPPVPDSLFCGNGVIILMGSVCTWASCPAVGVALRRMLFGAAVPGHRHLG